MDITKISEDDLRVWLKTRDPQFMEALHELQINPQAYQNAEELITDMVAALNQISQEKEHELDWLKESTSETEKTGLEWFEKPLEEEAAVDNSLNEMLRQATQESQPEEVPTPSAPQEPEIGYVDTTWPDFIDRLVQNPRIPTWLRGKVLQFLQTVSPGEIIQTAVLGYLYRKFILDEEDPDVWPERIRKWVNDLPQEAQKPAQDFLARISPGELVISAVSAYLYKKFYLDVEEKRQIKSVEKPDPVRKFKIGDQVSYKFNNSTFQGKVVGFKPSGMVMVQLPAGQQYARKPEDLTLIKDKPPEKPQPKERTEPQSKPQTLEEILKDIRRGFRGENK